MGARLSKETRALLRALLAWDRERIAYAERVRPNVDRTKYQARQARAEAAFAARTQPARWTKEIREHFQQVIEATGLHVLSGEPRVVIAHREPALRPPPLPVELTPVSAILAAAELGVLDILQARGDPPWRATAAVNLGRTT